MDINIVTLDIINSITEFDFYDTLTSSEISKRGGSHDKLNKIRAKSAANLGSHFDGITFRDSKGQLLALSKLRDLVRPRIEAIPKEELEKYVKKLGKDAKKMSKLYRDISK